MTMKDRLAERLRVLKDYGTAEEIEKVLGEITRETSGRKRNSPQSCGPYPLA